MSGQHSSDTATMQSKKSSSVLGSPSRIPIRNHTTSSPGKLAGNVSDSHTPGGTVKKKHSHHPSGNYMKATESYISHSTPTGGSSSKGATLAASSTPVMKTNSTPSSVAGLQLSGGPNVVSPAVSKMTPLSSGIGSSTQPDEGSASRRTPTASSDGPASAPRTPPSRASGSSSSSAGSDFVCATPPRRPAAAGSGSAVTNSSPASAGRVSKVGGNSGGRPTSAPAVKASAFSSTSHLSSSGSAKSSHGSGSGSGGVKVTMRRSAGAALPTRYPHHATAAAATGTAQQSEVGGQSSSATSTPNRRKAANATAGASSASSLSSRARVGSTGKKAAANRGSNTAHEDEAGAAAAAGEVSEAMLFLTPTRKPKHQQHTTPPSSSTRSNKVSTAAAIVAGATGVSRRRLGPGEQTSAEGTAAVEAAPREDIKPIASSFSAAPVKRPATSTHFASSAGGLQVKKSHPYLRQQANATVQSKQRKTVGAPASAPTASHSATAASTTPSNSSSSNSNTPMKASKGSASGRKMSSNTSTTISTMMLQRQQQQRQQQMAQQQLKHGVKKSSALAVHGKSASPPAIVSPNTVGVPLESPDVPEAPRSEAPDNTKLMPRPPSMLQFSGEPAVPPPPPIGGIPRSSLVNSPRSAFTPSPTPLSMGNPLNRKTAAGAAANGDAPLKMFQPLAVGMGQSDIEREVAEANCGSTSSDDAKPCFPVPNLPRTVPISPRGRQMSFGSGAEDSRGLGRGRSASAASLEEEGILFRRNSDPVGLNGFQHSSSLVNLSASILPVGVEEQLRSRRSRAVSDRQTWTRSLSAGDTPDRSAVRAKSSGDAAQLDASFSSAAALVEDLLLQELDASAAAPTQPTHDGLREHVEGANEADESLLSTIYPASGTASLMGDSELGSCTGSMGGLMLDDSSYGYGYGHYRTESSSPRSMMSTPLNVPAAPTPPKVPLPLISPVVSVPGHNHPGVHGFRRPANVATINTAPPSVPILSRAFSAGSASTSIMGGAELDLDSEGLDTPCTAGTSGTQRNRQSAVCSPAPALAGTIVDVFRRQFSDSQQHSAPASVSATSNTTALQVDSTQPMGNISNIDNSGTTPSSQINGSMCSTLYSNLNGISAASDLNNLISPGSVVSGAATNSRVGGASSASPIPSVVSVSSQSTNPNNVGMIMYDDDSASEAGFAGDMGDSSTFFMRRSTSVGQQSYLSGVSSAGQHDDDIVSFEYADDEVGDRTGHEGDVEETGGDEDDDGDENWCSHEEANSGYQNSRLSEGSSYNSGDISSIHAGTLSNMSASASASASNMGGFAQYMNNINAHVTADNNCSAAYSTADTASMAQNESLESRNRSHAEEGNPMHQSAVIGESTGLSFNQNNENIPSGNVSVSDVLPSSDVFRGALYSNSLVTPTSSGHQSVAWSRGGSSSTDATLPINRTIGGTQNEDIGSSYDVDMPFAGSRENNLSQFSDGDCDVAAAAGVHTSEPMSPGANGTLTGVPPESRERVLSEGREECELEDPLAKLLGQHA